MAQPLPYRITTLLELAGGITDRAFLTELGELNEKLRSGRPNVVVVGLFKRGKSSIVNALLGCALAPVDVTPQTAIITTFEHDPLRSLSRIYFRDGRTLETGILDIGPFVSEEQNPGNRKGVSIVRLFAHELPLLKTMTLIDTPGLGSALLHNTAETLAFVPRIDAALFVLSADLPVSESDIEFLKALKKNVPTILFVLNKKDLLTKAELEKLIAHNQQMIMTRVDLTMEQVNIIPVSPRRHEQGAIAAGNIDSLAAALCSAVDKDDHALFHHTVERRFDRLSDQLAFLLKTRMETLRLPLNELEQRAKRLRGIPALLASRKQDFDHLLWGQTQQLTEYVRHTVQAKADELRDALSGQLSGVPLLSPSDRRDCSRQLNQRIADAFDQVHSQLEEETKRRFRDALSHQALQPESFLAGLVQQLSEIAHISFSLIMGKFDLEIYAPFYLASRKEASSPKENSFLQRTLPPRLRERLLHQQLSNYYKELIIRDAAAVIYNLDYRIQESQRKFSAELQKRLSDLVNQLQAMLVESIRLHADVACSIDGSYDNLKEKLRRLDELRRPGISDEPIGSPANNQSGT